MRKCEWRCRSSMTQARSIQKFFTHIPVSTFDRSLFQLTGELFLYGMALTARRKNRFARFCSSLQINSIRRVVTYRPNRSLHTRIHASCRGGTR
jgi:hypothetical protein